MQESVIDILAYFIDDVLPNYEEKETNVEQMVHSLCSAGFTANKVGHAMNWFFSLADIPRPNFPTQEQSIRLFAPQETKFINTEGQDYLRGLLRIGALTPALFEMVIEKALALEEPLDTKTLRWVAYLVVMNNIDNDDPTQLAWQQYCLSDDTTFPTQ